MSNPASQHRFSRSARLTLAAALLLLLVDLGQLAYRFTLPTDGWSTYTTEVEEANYIFYSNLAGAPSNLQRGYILLKVEDVSLEGEATSALLAPPANWRVGETVTITVRRGGEELAVEVPVVRWTAAGFGRFLLDDLAEGIFKFSSLAMLLLGWFTFWRRPEIPSARALLLFSTALGATAISGLLPVSYPLQFDTLAWVPTGFFSFIIFGTLLAPSLLAFSLLFPRPKQILTRRPWLGLTPLAISLVVLGFVLTGVIIVGWLATLAMFIASIISLVHAWFTQRDAASRAQLRWAISGFVLGLGLFTLTFPVSFGWVTDQALVTLLSVLANLGILAIGSGLAVAVLRYRLYDIDVIIRRTLIYTLVTALLALVYSGSVVLLQLVFERFSGQRSPLAIVLSTLAIAALFTPLRGRVQRFIDRRFFRQKYNAQQVLARFALTARDETDLAVLTDELVRVIRETTQPAGVDLWLAGGRPESS